MLSRRSWRKSAAKKMVAGGPSEYCSVIRTALFAQRKKSARRRRLRNVDDGTDDRLGTFGIQKKEKSLHKNAHKIAPPSSSLRMPNITSLHPPPSAITSDGAFVAVVGFGSLLSRNSALFTAPNLRDFRVVRVHGYRRVFAHTSPIFFERNIANAETREIASLSVEEAKEHSFIGCRFEIPLKEYPALAVREAEFNFTGVETRDISTNEVVGESLSVCCVRGSDEVYTRKYCTKVLEGDENCECVKCKLKTFGEPMIWTDELILPTRTYCRHCVLAARGLGKVIEDDFLDNTFLADRKTRLREHLEKDPSILEELPPESLAVRYGG